MTSILDVTRVVGLPQHHGWSHIFLSSDKTVVVAYAIGGSDAHNVGKDVVELLQEKLEFGRHLSAPEFYQLIQKIQADVADKDAELSMAAVLQLSHDEARSGELLLAAVAASIWLKRQSKVAAVVKQDAALQVLQGELRKDDCLVLATQQAEGVLGEVTQKLQQGYEVDSIVTSLVPGLHGQDDSSLSALGFVVLKAENVPAAIDVEQSIVGSLDLGVGAMSLHEDETTESELELERQRESDSELSLSPAVLEATSEESEQPDAATTLPPAAVVSGTEVVQKSGAMLSISSASLANAVQSVVKVVARGTRLSASLWLRFKPRAGGVYVGSASRRRVARAVMGVVVVGLLALGLGAWSWQRSQARARQLEAQLTPLTQSFEMVQQQIESDPITARQQTEQLLSELSQAQLNLKSQKVNTKPLEDLERQVQEFFDQHSGRAEFSQLPTFFDLRTIDTEFITTVLEYDTQNKVGYFVDAERARLIKLNFDTKQQQLWDLSRLDPSMGRIADVQLRTPSKLVVLSDQGLFELDTTSSTETPSVTRLRPSEEQLQQATQVETFGDYIYVLNNDKKAIYRYVPADQGYADPTTWSAAAGLPLTDISSMVIDGDVWLANDSGQLAKMRSGRAETFEVRGLPSPSEGKLQLFTTEAEDSDLFVLESDQHRIFRLSKTGEFVQELSSGTLASATQLVVDQAAGVAYVVSGAEIFELKLSE